MAKRKTPARTPAPERPFTLRRGLLYHGGHLLAVPPLLVSLCLARAGLERTSCSSSLPPAVGQRILRIGTYLVARATLPYIGGHTDEPA
ncbi:MAG TPA: hypothetical protein VNO22_18760 [Planctomycetota bacterium]|nr:hypothetical protein [Planctomycetota bacterium]